MMQKQSGSSLSIQQPQLPVDSKMQDEPVLACASTTRKPLNRDAFISIHNPALQINGIAVADGIGNTMRVEEASRLVVDCASTRMSEFTIASAINMNDVFLHCKNKMDEVFGQCITHDQFGTTLIIALEYFNKETRQILAGYMGNGAIWHIKGNFNHFNRSQLVPWNAVNYLNPHSIQQNGQEVLTNCISLASMDKFAGPSTVSISCDKTVGDIIMICTDGIYSYDQVLCAQDGCGEVWQKYGPAMTIFFEYLNKFFSQAEYSNETLRKILVDYLEKLKDDELLDDDATIGVMIMPDALNYQGNLLKHEQNNYDQQN